MDTDYDFIKPEFLNILFFQQKNLVIFPYVDLKHLRALQVFTVGFSVIDIDSTAIHNLNEIIEYEASSYSQQPTFYFVLNPKTEEIEKLINSPKVRCVVNTREIVENLANGTRFVFYNKKSKTFVNYEPEKQDLSFEKHLIRSYPDKQLLLDEMIKIKSIATKIFLQLNESSNPDNLPELLRDYAQIYWDKILNFTRLYYDIEIPNFDRPKPLPRKNDTSEPEEEKDYSSEYEIIMKVNRKIGQKFIQLIHNYRFEKVNPANLEVPQLFYPRMLYNYLRNHHWENGIPQKFVSEWIQATTADISFTEVDHVEFQMVLNKLGYPYPIPEFNAVNVSSSHLKRETPTQIIREEKDPKTVPSLVKEAKKIKRVKQEGSDSIPQIENFREFRQWMLKKLGELENTS